MKRNYMQLRRALLLGLAALSTAGCASTKSGSSDAFGGTTQPQSSGFVDSISSTTKGIGGQIKSMGTAVSSAFSKTKNAVTSPFTGGSTEGESDPTSLSNMPLRAELGPEIWVTNGQLYESQGNFGKALDNYTKALEQEPSNEAALLSTARLYARQKQYAQAAEFYSKSIASYPQAGTYDELAACLQEQGQVAEAQTAVRKAIEMDGGNPQYRNHLASLLVTGGRSDEAVNELQQVFPPAVANYHVAYMHYQNQNVAASQEHLRTALQLDPNLAVARDLMSKVNSSPVAQSALAAYNTAGNIYRTAEAVTSPNTQANTAVYQLPQANTASATQPAAMSGGLPTSPAAATMPSAATMPQALPRPTSLSFPVSTPPAAQPVAGSCCSSGACSTGQSASPASMGMQCSGGQCSLPGTMPTSYLPQKLPAAATQQKPVSLLPAPSKF